MNLDDNFDKCIFHREGLLLVMCVDDAGIAAPNREIIMTFVGELREEGFDLDIEGDLDPLLVV